MAKRKAQGIAAYSRLGWSTGAPQTGAEGQRALRLHAPRFAQEGGLYSIGSNKIKAQTNFISFVWAWLLSL